VRPSEYIGRRVRELREARKMSQQQLGDELGRWLEKPWPRQTVSMAELGKRAFAADELVALAVCLRVPVTRLVAPLLFDKLMLPGGEVEPPREDVAGYESFVRMHDAAFDVNAAVAEVSRGNTRLRSAWEHLCRELEAAGSHLPHIDDEGDQR
jgi:transcriptional regulator with XRE-family HTH domain